MKMIFENGKQCPEPTNRDVTEIQEIQMVDLAEDPVPFFFSAK